MEEKDIPLYVIVELLIRLSEFESVGNYKNHYIKDGQAYIFTQRMEIRIPVSLLLRQFEQPEDISMYELKSLL